MDPHLDDLSALLTALGAAFQNEPRPGGQHAARALMLADASAARIGPSVEDPADLLAAAVAAPDAMPLAGLVLKCHPVLHWTCWEGDGLSPTISRRLFTTELLGPAGVIPAPDLRVGLLLSAPRTDYPLSRHAGEETYLVISGTADWAVGGPHYAPQEPGALIHHPAWVVHGRRTGAEAFLGAWRWSGDLDLSTFALAPD